MSLQKYLELNLDVGSPVAKDLWSKLDQESQSDQLSLTAIYSADGIPAYLTSAMNTWYNRHIQPLRRSAVQEIVEAFHAMVVPKSGLRGKLFEHERDRIDLEAFQKAAEERMQFERNTNIIDVHRDLGLERQRYETLVQEHGEAVKWRPWLYWGVLIFMIGFVEGLLNLESFLKIPGFTPALSTGSFLVVSAAFAASAHLVGLMLKQWRERLGGGVSRTEKMKNTAILFAIAVPLFVLAFAYVVYARWALLGDVILRKSQTTGEEIGTWEVVLFAGTLIGNIIVYVMGTALAYLLTWYQRLDRRMAEAAEAARPQPAVRSGDRR